MTGVVRVREFFRAETGVDKPSRSRFGLVAALGCALLWGCVTPVQSEPTDQDSGGYIDPGVVRPEELAPNSVTDVPVYVEYADKIRTSEQVTPLESDYFGESVSLYNGQTEFGNVDIDVPGNNGLPVQLRRRFAIKPQVGGQIFDPYGGMSDWDIDVPHMSGTFDLHLKWDQTSPTAAPTPRCSSQFVPTAPSSNSVGIGIRDVWSGVNVHVPGQGSKELLAIDAMASPPQIRPAGSGHLWTTTGMDAFSCVTTANGSHGEGFEMTTPDGVKYTFDWYLERNAPGIRKGSNLGLGRKVIYLLASKVTDRHGNEVQYTYNGDGLPISIAETIPNSGRRIDLVYQPSSRRLSTATVPGNGTAPDRVWRYSYDNSPDKHLEYAELPDHSLWHYEHTGDLYVTYSGGSTNALVCPPPEPGQGSFELTITHPSGAMGNFSFSYGRQYRRASFQCADGFPTPPPYFDAFSLDSKTVSYGMGSAYEWLYSFGSGICGECAYKTVTVQNPEFVDPDSGQLVRNKTEYHFGFHHGVNEGRLLETLTKSHTNEVLRSEVNEYLSEADIIAGQPFPSQYGIVYGGDDGNSAAVRPLRSVTITQQGSTFKRSNVEFDGYVRPVRTFRSGPNGLSQSERIEITIYKDYPNANQWILGQVQSVHLKGDSATRDASMVWNEYDSSNANLLESWKFGRLQRRMTYRADGTLWTVTDGAGSAHTTTLDPLKRGIPPVVTFADNTSKTADIDDLGQIRSVTDEVGSKTSYSYDSMGRLATITYPADKGKTWNATSTTYTRTNTSEFGISGLHWQQTTATGNARKVTTFDALWRPVLTEEYDAANRVPTTRYVRRSFDHANRETFVSYPSGSPSSNSGTRTDYDALGRAIRVTQDSELGALVTKLDYLAGFRKQVTDPRNNVTTTTYSAYDAPTEDSPMTIASPEGVTVSIERDLFSKPTAVTRSGSYAGASIAATRSYVYDSNQLLCKTIEPETGATVQAYDAAGNLNWVAKGSTLTSLNCDRDSVPLNQRTVYSYDDRNRLTNTQYRIGTSPVTQTWYPDGALATLSTNGAIWTYSYNHRRLLEQESLAYDGKTFKIDWTHNANGHVDGLIYPDTTAIAFAPNALGQPTQAGSYATAVSYYPNGGMRNFTYGNGIVHRLFQNQRQLPVRSYDVGTVDFTYGYDPNGNVQSIVDNLPGAVASRSMAYDDLDRLISTSAPNLWETATFTYDPLDNLRTSQVGLRNCTHAINGINRLTSLSGPNCPTISYSYDTLGRGNVVQRAGQTFSFDGADRITATNGTGGAESYVYDGHGRRVRITRGIAKKTYPLYSLQGQLLQELGSDGKTTNYVYLNGSLVARTGDGDEGGGTVPPSPPTPTVTPAISTTGHYAVAWSIPPNVTSMKLLESVNGGTPAAVQPAPAVGDITWSPSSARASGTYVYTLRACNANGCSVPGAQGTVFVVRSPSGLTWAPQPLGVNTPYTVKWDGVTTAFSYQLQEKIGANWTDVNSNGTQSSQNGRPAGNYPYHVKACRNGICSDYSAVVTVQVQTGTCAPEPPAGISITPTDSPNGAFTVNWLASPSACVTSYQLEEKYNQSQYELVHLTDTQLQNREWSPDPPKTLSGTYAYRVKACGGGQCSYAVGNVVTVSLPVVLPMPAVLQACRIGGVGSPPCAMAGSTLTLLAALRGVDYRVSWNPVQGATSYQYKLTWRSAEFPTVHIGSPQPVYEDHVDVLRSNPPTWLENSYQVRACAGAESTCSGWTDSVTVRIEKNRPAGLSASGVVYLHTDALGSPVVETDASGAEIANSRTHYEPYGRPTTGVYKQGPGYTGHVTDATTGLSYMQQRYYDPMAGRFLSVDPVVASPVSFNRYWYANNNPYRFKDPDGRKEKPFVAGTDAPRTAHGGTKTPINQSMPMPSQSLPYNCHSYAWHGGKGDPSDPGNEGLPPKWDNSPADDMKEATRLDSEAPNKLGDIVVYGKDANSNGSLEGREIDHSAKVSAVDGDGNTTRVESKEGQSSITDHHPSDQNPAYGNDKEWYRQKD